MGIERIQPIVPVNGAHNERQRQSQQEVPQQKNKEKSEEDQAADLARIAEVRKRLENELNPNLGSRLDITG